jgi:DNA invertase Pin-like site-specific DNA recombinase
MIAAYIRVSTRDQSTQSQRAEIERWISGNGIQAEGVSWYEDQESGTTLQRPEFERLKADIFRGLVKTVVLWKLDRLSRNLRDGVNVLADWADRGLKIVVVTQQLELAGVLGRTIAALLLGLAEIEYGNIRERQRAGIEAAKARGVYKGRPAKLKNIKVAKARSLKARGFSAQETAQALGVSRRTVIRYIKTS